MSQQGLPIARLIAVAVILAPNAAQAPAQNVLMIVGNSPGVIKVGQRWRKYTSLQQIASDFGTTAGEYLGAKDWFSQQPQPESVIIGRWASSGTNGYLDCGPLSGSETVLSTWTAITNGSFAISVNGGGPTNITGLNFSSAVSFAAIATLISAALTTASVPASCSYKSQTNNAGTPLQSTTNWFEFTTNATGAGKIILPLTAAGSGTDIHASPLNGTKATGAVETDGIATESALTAVTILDGLVPFYGLTFATNDSNTDIVDADHEAIAAYIEGASTRHMYGVSSQEAGILDPASTTDIAYILSQALYDRSGVQYSSTDPYVYCSYFGRLLTVNLDESDSAITMMYKQEPGVTPEYLSDTQEAAMIAKKCNAFVWNDNGTAIIENGVQCSGLWSDELFGVDWLANAIQTNCFNVLYESTTKVSQTDAGNHQLATVMNATCKQQVSSGFLAPGKWTTGGFGQLVQGQFLKKGYYVYQPPISTQSDSDRDARKSVNFQIAAKTAGAIHDVSITVTVNQ